MVAGRATRSAPPAWAVRCVSRATSADRARPEMAADRRDQRLVGHRRRQLPRSRRAGRGSPALRAASSSARDERALARAALTLDEHDRALTVHASWPAASAGGRVHGLARTGARVTASPQVLRTYEYVQGTDAPAGRVWLTGGMTLTSPIPQPVRTGRTASPARLTTPFPSSVACAARLRSGLLEALWRWQPCTAAELATRAHLPRTRRRAHPRRPGRRWRGGRGRARDDAAGLPQPAPPDSVGAARRLRGEHLPLRRDRHRHPCRRDDRYTGVLPVIGRFHDGMAEQRGAVARTTERPGAGTRCGHGTVVARAARESTRPSPPSPSTCRR